MPNRIIKESICVSDSIDSLSWFEEVLFYRLIVNCDDYGRFDGRAAVIKSRLFPLKDSVTVKAVSDAINKLASAELVTLYVFEGKPYLYLPTWDKHQQVRARRSKYPEPSSDLISSDIICNQMISDVPVIQSENESENESESESKSAREEAFDVFWAAYPRKVGKGAARKAFAKLPAAVFPLLVPAVEAQKQCAQWRKNGGEYIPNPATWLNQERWEDKLPDTRTANAKAQELDDFYSMTQDWARRDDE